MELSTLVCTSIIIISQPKKWLMVDPIPLDDSILIVDPISKWAPHSCMFELHTVVRYSQSLRRRSIEQFPLVFSKWSVGLFVKHWWVAKQSWPGKVIWGRGELCHALATFHSGPWWNIDMRAAECRKKTIDKIVLTCRTLHQSCATNELKLRQNHK